MSDPVIFPQFSVEGLPITYVPNPYSADGKPIDSQWKEPVRVHTTGNITLSGLQVIDTIGVMEGDRVLVKDQINPAENGLYNASSGTWRRTNDMYLWEQFVGAVVAVEEGATTNDTVWICQAPAAGTPDVTPNNWIPVSAVAGTLGVYTPLRALVTDVLGNPVASATTAQEIAYVSGVTSSVQQQFNALSNQASSAFSIAVDGTNAAAGAQSTADTALSTANSAYALAQTGTNSIAAVQSTANAAYALAQVGTNTGTAAYQLAQTGSNIAYDAYAIAVTGTNIGSLAYGLATSIGNKYVRTTRFASIGSTTGTVALPPNSTVVLDDFGGGVDAVITTISAGYPTFSHAFTAAGDIVTTSFDAGGNYTLSGAPSAYPVALIYRVRQTLSDFDSTSGDIIGDYDVESIDAIIGTPNQVYVNGSTSVQFGSITLSLPQDIAPTSTPTFAGLTSTGSVYSPNIDQTTQVAYSGSNVAWSAWVLAQVGTESGSVGDVYAVIGTPNQVYTNGTSSVLVAGTVTFSLPQDIGTNSSPTFANVYSSNIAAIENTANSAFSIAQVGTNTGTAAYTLADSGSAVAWAAWELAQVGTNTGTADYNLILTAQSTADAAYALAQIGTNTGTAALNAAATAQSTADSAYFIAVIGTNTGTAALNAAASAQSTADSAFSVAQIGTNTGSTAYSVAQSAWALAQIGTNTGTAALSAAASAQSTADSAYFIAEIGTNTGTAAYTLAESGSNVAWAAWVLANAGTELPQSSYDLALAAYHLAQIGTNTGTAALEAAGTAYSVASAAFSIAVDGTNAAATAQSTADFAYYLAQVGTNTGTAALSAAASAQSTADSAYFIAEIGTNTGTAAYTLAESGSNVAWAAWVLANTGTELPQSSYDLALAAYHLAQIGTNTGTAALEAAGTAQSTADFAYYLAQVGTNTGTAALAAAASAQSTADSAYFIAQVGTNTGTAAYTLAQSGSNVAWSAWTLANAGTELPQSSYDLALSAYHLAQIGTNTGSAAYSTAQSAYSIASIGTNTGSTAYSVAESAWLLAQIGTNTGTAALAAAASAQSTADSAFSIASIGTNTGSTAYSVAESAWNLAQIGTNTGTAAYSLAQTGSNLAWTAYEIAQAGTAPISLTQLTDVTLSGPTAQQVLTYTGSYWTNDDVPIVISPSSFNLYLDDTASGTAGYNTLKTVSTGPEVLDAISVTSNNPTPIESYLSNFVDVTVLPAGIWGFESYVSAANTGRSVVVTTDIYRRSIAGVETYLFSGTTDVFSPVVTPTRVIATSSTGSFAVSSTDKLVAKYWFIKSAGGNTTFTLYHNGSNHASYIQTPLGLVHNQLSGLQGGGANEFYHATQNEYDALVGDGGTPSAANPYSTHQTVAAVQNTADSAFLIAQIGTNTGTAAYNLAQANSAVYGVSTFTAGTTLPASPGRRVWLGNTSGGQAVFALPTATNWVGYVVHVKKVSTDGNAVIVRSATGTATIDGVLDQSFTTPYMSLQLTTDGTNWYIL